MKETGASWWRQMIFIWFPVVPEIQSTVQASQKTYPASAAQIYSQMLWVSLKAMAFRHLGNNPVAIPMEIKKNSLFWGTTACRTDSRTSFLRLTLKTQASTFKTDEVSSNSFCARTMALWLRAKRPWHGWSLHQTLWKQNFRMAFKITLIWLAVSLGLPQLPEPVGSPSLVKESWFVTPLIRPRRLECANPSIITLVWKTTVVLQDTQCETWLTSFLHKQDRSLPSQSCLYLSKTFVRLRGSLNLLEPFPEWRNRHCKWTMTQKPPCTRKYPIHSKGILRSPFLT